MDYGWISWGQQNVDGVTYYPPFPILKNRARFFFTLCGIVNQRFPLSGRDTLPQVVRIDKFLDG